MLCYIIRNIKHKKKKKVFLSPWATRKCQNCCEETSCSSSSGNVADSFPASKQLGRVKSGLQGCQPLCSEVCVCEREKLRDSPSGCSSVCLSTELRGQRALRCAKHVSSSVPECALNDTTPPGLHCTLSLYSQLSKTKTDSLINTGIQCYFLLQTIVSS